MIYDAHALRCCVLYQLRREDSRIVSRVFCRERVQTCWCRPDYRVLCVFISLLSLLIIQQSVTKTHKALGTHTALSGSNYPCSGDSLQMSPASNRINILPAQRIPHPLHPTVSPCIGNTRVAIYMVEGSSPAILSNK